jgi:hypothetical protein
MHAVGMHLEGEAFSGLSRVCSRQQIDALLECYPPLGGRDNMYA